MATEETRRSERRDAARRWLARFGTCVMANMCTIDLIGTVEELMTSITQRWEECSTSSASDAMANQLGRLQELCEQLDENSQMYGEYLDEMAEAVYLVGEVNANAGCVLACRYMSWGRPMEFEEIAAEMNYSPDWVRHLHAEGLDIVAEILERRDS